MEHVLVSISVLRDDSIHVCNLTLLLLIISKFFFMYLAKCNVNVTALILKFLNEIENSSIKKLKNYI